MSFKPLKNRFTTSSKSDKNVAVVLRIEADYIYRFNTATVEFTSTAPFRISIKSAITVIEISKGQFDSKTNVYKAEEKDGVYTVKILVLGLFKETPIENIDQINEAVNSYGMQFYPFISSKLKLELTSLSLPLRALILNIPDNFRIIWYRRKAQNPLGQDARINHSYSQTKACYVFDWSESGIGDYELEVLLRLGGNSLWQIVEFPRFYFYIALFAIAVSSFHEQFYVLFAAIVAVWLFLVTHWSKTYMPQQNTIVTKIYLFLLGTSFIYGIMWELHWV
jgi:hypothetical protein